MPSRNTALAGTPCWIDVLTSDPDKTVPFYQDLFGWTADDSSPEFGGYFSFRKDGELVAGCMPFQEGIPGVPNVWSIYLATEDAEQTAKSVTAEGGTVLSPPMAIGDLGTMLFVADAGGAAVGAWQAGSHAGIGRVAEPGTPAWFELWTRDYDAAVAFYRTVFGWDAHTASDEPDFRYTTLGQGDSMAAGIMDASAFLPEGVPAHWSVYITVADADAAQARVTELGGTVVDPAKDTPYGRMATVADPAGAQFKLIQLPS